MGNLHTEDHAAEEILLNANQSKKWAVYVP